MNNKFFVSKWLEVQEGYEKTPSQSMIFMAWSALSIYTDEQLEFGIQAHISDRKQGKFVPTPSHIIDQIESALENDGRPEVNEAWTLVPKSENESTVWTEEVKSSFWICLPLLNNGEETAARMAFRESYTKALAQARKDRTPVRWSVSQGQDVTGREIAISNAVQKKLISKETGTFLLLGSDSTFQDDPLKIESDKDKKKVIADKSHRKIYSKIISDHVSRILEEMNQQTATDDEPQYLIDKRERDNEFKRRKAEALAYSGISE